MLSVAPSKDEFPHPGVTVRSHHEQIYLVLVDVSLEDGANRCGLGDALVPVSPAAGKVLIIRGRAAHERATAAGSPNMARAVAFLKFSSTLPKRGGEESRDETVNQVHCCGGNCAGWSD